MARVRLLLVLAALCHVSLAVTKVVALPEPPAVLATAAAAAAAGAVPVALAALEAAVAAAAADGAAAALAGGAGAQARHLLGAPKPAAAGSPSKRCQPTMLTLAKQLPELRQAVALAEAGYNMFEADGGKAFTLLAPSDAALQALAAGLADSDKQKQQLQDGFPSIVLYNQLPGGAYDVDQLVALQGDGMQTSLGRATRNTYTVSFDNNTLPVVATGGWPSNNAQLLSSRKACNGWLHVVASVLLPSQLGSLPRLVDDTPDLPNSVFMGLIDGSGVAPAGAEPPAPPPEDGGAAGGSPAAGPPPSHSGSTDIVVSNGDGSPSDANAADVLAGSSGGSGNSVLVVAASVAAGAVALCAAVVAGVLLRKRQLRRRRQAQHSRLAEEEEEEEFQSAASKASMRPVQLHVDA